MKHLILILLVVIMATTIHAQVETTAKKQYARAEMNLSDAMYYYSRAGITNHGGANDSLRTIIGQPGTAYWIPIGGGAKSFYNTTVVDYWKARYEAAVDTLQKYKAASK